MLPVEVRKQRDFGSFSLFFALQKIPSSSAHRCRARLPFVRHGSSRRRNASPHARRAAARLRRSVRARRRRREPGKRRRALRDRRLRTQSRIRLHRARPRRFVREHGQRREERGHASERHRGDAHRLRHERLQLRPSLRQPLELAGKFTAAKRDALDAANEPAASLTRRRSSLAARWRSVSRLRATRSCRAARPRSMPAHTCDRRRRDRRSETEIHRPSRSPPPSRAASASCRSDPTRTRRA